MLQEQIVGSYEEAIALARSIGYPVRLKGCFNPFHEGKVVQNITELADVFNEQRRQSPTEHVYLEKV